VLLVPGFGFGDRSLALTRNWLRARGYQAIGSRTGLNIGCTTTMVTRLETTLERHVETTGRKVIILGQSRGGWLGRIVAMRRPDLVGGLIMLASAVLNPLAGKAKFLAVARFIARLGSAGLPGVLDQDCLTGQCYRVNRAHLLNPLPSEIPAVSVYSRHDEIAPWELCRDPSAEHVEVHSTHTGMALNPDVYTALLPRLTRWAS
jgi:pimeloyl-ACP methyl ester carboxylesterase